MVALGEFHAHNSHEVDWPNSNKRQKKGVLLLTALDWLCNEKLILILTLVINN